MFVLALAVLAACDDDDADAGNDSGTTTTATVVAEDDDATATATAADSDEPTATATATPENDDAADGDDDSAGLTGGALAERCASVFTLDEVAALFGDEAILDEQDSYDDEAAQELSCWWTTDPESAQSRTLLVEFYGGGIVAGYNPINPNFYDDVEEVEGIGDQASKAMPPSRVMFAFRDGDTAGLLMHLAEDAWEHEDEMLELFRTFHDRVR